MATGAPGYLQVLILYLICRCYFITGIHAGSVNG